MLFGSLNCCWLAVCIEVVWPCVVVGCLCVLLLVFNVKFSVCPSRVFGRLCVMLLVYRVYFCWLAV